MRLTVTCLFLFSCCLGSENDSWFDQVKTRTDQNAVDWLREKIKLDLPKIDQLDLTTFTQNPCKHCFSGGLFDMEPKIYVFMSFSLPEETWLTLSTELKRYSAVFVVSGLPNDSFPELAKRLAQLKRKGMSTAVLVDPNLFKQFQIENSPTFVFTDGIKVHKISGNISLEYALEYMAPN